MNRYFFNFRKGDECSRDRIGMYLPNLDAARAEALYVWRELAEVARTTGEVLGGSPSVPLRGCRRQGATFRQIWGGRKRRCLWAAESSRAPACH